jgi:hypothetical protein
MPAEISCKEKMVARSHPKMDVFGFERSAVSIQQKACESL